MKKKKHPYIQNTRVHVMYTSLKNAVLTFKLTTEVLSTHRKRMEISIGEQENKKQELGMRWYT